MNISLKESNLVKTTPFVLTRDNGKKVEGIVIYELTYVIGGLVRNISIEMSSKSDDLTPEEEQKVIEICKYKEEAV